ncbi:MAG: SUMF1/EgtB/PvdO family nonheme iron enzyme [Fibrobacteria bacterium]|nr:SUMF1/EgtB/PvdO family nonheme iron enzyme [Fibrobacteria bacterium]
MKLNILVLTAVVSIFLFSNCNLLKEEEIEENRYLRLDVSQIDTTGIDDIIVSGVNEKSTDTVTIYTWKSGEKLETKLFVPDKLTGDFSVIFIAKKDNKVELTHTMILNEVGIPIVTGLTAVYDTLMGIVKLSWNKSSYSNFQEYAIFKDDFDVINKTLIPFGKATDTDFNDTIFHKNSPTQEFSFLDSIDYHYKYRVAVRSNSEELGATHKSAGIIAVSPIKMQPTFDFTIKHAVKNQEVFDATINDTLRFILKANMIYRKISKIVWRDLDNLSEIDTTAFTTPIAPAYSTVFYSWKTTGNKNFELILIDDANTQWKDTISTRIIPDLPTAIIDATPLTLTMNDDVIFKIDGFDKYGMVDEYALKLGNRNWEKVSPGDTVIPAPDFLGTWICSLRVIDDDSNESFQSLEILIQSSKPTAIINMPWFADTNEIFNVQASNSKDSGYISKYEWKFGDSPWKIVTKGDTSFITPKIPQTMICSLKLTDDDGEIAYLKREVFVGPISPSGMKLIPSKNSYFQMGQKGIIEPVHTVHLTNNFYMDSTEVTAKDYCTLMSETYSSFREPTTYDGQIRDGFAINDLNWYDAVLYCNARSKKHFLDTVYAYSSITWKEPDRSQLSSSYRSVLNDLSIDINKKGYRLPTEAEWEFACRGGTTTLNYFSDMPMEKYAWFSCGEHQLVATKKPNNYGLYDMIGNLHELVNDNYHIYTSDSTSPPEVNPTGTLTSQDNRVIRGGSCITYKQKLYSAWRDVVPAYHTLKFNGFRVVLPAQ